MNQKPAAIIETKRLCRNFKKTKAVVDLNLDIRTGEIFGLLGPDGAGKTTTLRLLAGLLRISKGSARVAGFDLRRQSESIKPFIGYMAQKFSLYTDLSVRENLEFFADLYAVPHKDRDSRMRRLLKFSQLTEFQDTRAAHLSGGMQKKMVLATVLLHEPEILILDEPTTGVDPVSRREFWDLITELHLAGKTILISTPYMDEAERCQRVCLMFQGNIMMCDEPEKIFQKVPGELIEFYPKEWKRTQTILSTIPGVLEIQTYGHLLRVFLDSAEKRMPTIKQTLESAGLEYTDLRKGTVHMEEAFISLIRAKQG